MSLYRTVYTALPCMKCGQTNTTAVQFRTGEDNLEEYQQGDVLTEPGAMRMGEHYPGTADAFCKECLQQRKREEADAFYQTLAELVESGKLKLQKGLFKKTIKLQEILQWGEESAVRFYSGDMKIPSPFTLLGEYDLVWDGHQAKQGTPPYSILLEHLNERMAAKMRFSGWTTLNLLRDDLTVTLDENHRIQAERCHASHTL